MRITRTYDAWAWSCSYSIGVRIPSELWPPSAVVEDFQLLEDGPALPPRGGQSLLPSGMRKALLPKIGCTISDTLMRRLLYALASIPRWSASASLCHHLDHLGYLLACHPGDAGGGSSVIRRVGVRWEVVLAGQSLARP